MLTKWTGTSLVRSTPAPSSPTSRKSSSRTTAAHPSLSRVTPPFPISPPGIILGDAWVDPVSQAQYGTFAYANGLIDKNYMYEVKAREATVYEQMKL